MARHIASKSLTQPLSLAIRSAHSSVEIGVQVSVCVSPLAAKDSGVLAAAFSLGAS